MLTALREGRGVRISARVIAAGIAHLALRPPGQSAGRLLQWRSGPIAGLRRAFSTGQRCPLARRALFALYHCLRRPPAPPGENVPRRPHERDAVPPAETAAAAAVQNPPEHRRFPRPNRPRLRQPSRPSAPPVGQRLDLHAFVVHLPGWGGRGRAERRRAPPPLQACTVVIEHPSRRAVTRRGNSRASGSRTSLGQAGGAGVVGRRRGIATKSLRGDMRTSARTWRYLRRVWGEE